MESTADITYFKSQLLYLSFKNGVGTQIIYASETSGAVLHFSFPCFTTDFTNSPNPGSSICILPALIVLTISSFTSAPMTSKSLAANIVAVGNPMYPRPITHIFIY